jgi:DNA-binding response OmpR family regulator
MSKRILLIDSDTQFVAETTGALEGDGYEVTHSNDGRDALDAVRRERPDAVVLSVELPKSSGYAICSKLKKDQTLREIPVILTSAEATEKTFEDHGKLKIGRADGYLLKPFEPEALLAKLSGLVGTVETLEEADLDLEDEPFASADEHVEAEEEPVSMDVVEEISVDDVVPTPENLPSERDVDALDQAFHELEGANAGVEVSHDTNGLSPSDVGDLTRIEPFPLGFSPSNALAEDLDDEDEEHRRALESLEEEVEASEAVPEIDQEDSLTTATPGLAAELDAQTSADTSVADQPERPPERAKGTRDRDLRDRERDRDENLRLREELNTKEKQLLEQRDQELRLERQLAQRDTDIGKRDSQVRQLQQKVETLVAGQRRTEKDLTAVRDEFLRAQEKHGLAESERAAALSETQRSRERAERAESELREARTQIADLSRELEEQRARNDELAAELAGVRAQFEEAQAATEELRQEMQRQREEDDAIQDDLRRHVADMEEAQTRNEERVVKAYQRIKGDERVKEKTRKALTIALQLLEDQTSEDVEDEQRS